MTPRPTSTTDSGAVDDDAQHSTARKRHGTQGKRESTPQPRPPLGHVTEKLNCVHLQADETVPGLSHIVAEAQVFAYKYMDQRLKSGDLTAWFKQQKATGSRFQT